MLDGKKYLKSFADMKLAKALCPHCGIDTISASGRSTFCNFCEQYVNISESAIRRERGEEIAFQEVHAAVGESKWDVAAQTVEEILEQNVNPKTLYLSALFYKHFSDVRYLSRDYNLKGFMEQNADNIRTSLDLTFKWKEYFYKAIKQVRDALKSGNLPDSQPLFIKFMSEIKLHRLVDAGVTLTSIKTSGKPLDFVPEYSSMVFAVEANAKDAEEHLGRWLARNDVNAYFYLAKYLAKQKRLQEASALLEEIKRRTNIFMAAELLNQVNAAIEASKL